MTHTAMFKLYRTGFCFLLQVSPVNTSTCIIALQKSAPFQSCSHCASTTWMISQSHFQILAVHSCLDNSEFTMEISVAISALSAHFQILAVHSCLDNSEFTKEISVAISALKEMFRQSLNSCNNLQNFPLSTAEQSSPAREQKLFQKL